MIRVRVASTGYVGAPGLSSFYFSPSAETLGDAAAASARVRTFFNAISASFVTTTVFTVNPQVDVMSPTTGAVTNSLIVDTPELPVAGVASATLALPPQVAVLIQWRSNTFEQGRRLAGRTFLSPLSGQMSTAGVVTAASRTIVLNAAVALLGPGGPADLNLVVWRRPRAVRTLPTVQVARVGSVARVVTVGVPTKFATLNSRRD